MAMVLKFGTMDNRGVQLFGRIVVGAVVVCLTLLQQPVLGGEITLELNSFTPLDKFGDDWVDWHTLHVKKVSSTELALTGDFIVKKNLGDQQQFIMQFYKVMNGQRGTPMFMVSKGFCQILNEYKDTYQNIVAASNVPGDYPCPFPKGDYTINDYMLDSNFFPQNSPPGNYIIAILIQDRGTNVAGLELDITIEQ